MTQSQFPSKVAVLVLCWAAGALVPSGCEVALSDESEGGGVELECGRDGCGAAAFRTA